MAQSSLHIKKPTNMGLSFHVQVLFTVSRVIYPGSTLSTFRHSPYKIYLWRLAITLALIHIVFIGATLPFFAGTVLQIVAKKQITFDTSLMLESRDPVRSIYTF